MAIPLAIFRRPVRHEERVLTTAAPGGGPGSNIIATDHMGAQFIDILRARMVVRQLGATVLNDLRGNVDIRGSRRRARPAGFRECGDQRGRSPVRKGAADAQACGRLGRILP